MKSHLGFAYSHTLFLVEKNTGMYYGNSLRIQTKTNIISLLSSSLSIIAILL